VESIPLVIEAAPPRRRVIADMLDLTKPRLSALVLVTTGVGYAVAPGHARMWDLLLVVLGTAATVAAANTFNCWLERETDARMRRTSSRPLPAGRLPHWIAVFQGTFLAFVSIPFLVLAANPLTAFLALAALVSYVLVYTPMKRVSSAATIVGAVPGALPPLIGWTAARGRIELPGLILFAILFLWQIPHFLALSIVLVNDYASAGLKVLPLDGGDRLTRWNVVLWSLALVAVSLLAVPAGLAGTVYAISAIVLGAAFLFLAVRGLSRKAGRSWAISLFAGSIVYLTLLFAVLVLDARA